MEPLSVHEVGSPLQRTVRAHLQVEDSCVRLTVDASQQSWMIPLDHIAEITYRLRSGPALFWAPWTAIVVILLIAFHSALGLLVIAIVAVAIVLWAIRHGVELRAGRRAELTICSDVQVANFASTVEGGGGLQITTGAPFFFDKSGHSLTVRFDTEDVGTVVGAVGAQIIGLKMGIHAARPEDLTSAVVVTEAYDIRVLAAPDEERRAIYSSGREDGIGRASTLMLTNYRLIAVRSRSLGKFHTAQIRQVFLDQLRALNWQRSGGGIPIRPGLLPIPTIGIVSPVRRLNLRVLTTAGPPAPPTLLAKTTVGRSVAVRVRYGSVSSIDAIRSLSGNWSAERLNWFVTGGASRLEKMQQELGAQIVAILSGDAVGEAAEEGPRLEGNAPPVNLAGEAEKIAWSGSWSRFRRRNGLWVSSRRILLDSSDSIPARGRVRVVWEVLLRDDGAVFVATASDRQSGDVFVRGPGLPSPDDIVVHARPTTLPQRKWLRLKVPVVGVGEQAGAVVEAVNEILAAIRKGDTPVLDAPVGTTPGSVELREGRESDTLSSPRPRAVAQFPVRMTGRSGRPATLVLTARDLRLVAGSPGDPDEGRLWWSHGLDAVVGLLWFRRKARCEAIVLTKTVDLGQAATTRRLARHGVTWTLIRFLYRRFLRRRPMLLDETHSYPVFAVEPGEEAVVQELGALLLEGLLGSSGGGAVELSNDPGSARSKTTVPVRLAKDEHLILDHSVPNGGVWVSEQRVIVEHRCHGWSLTQEAWLSDVAGVEHHNVRGRRGGAGLVPVVALAAVIGISLIRSGGGGVLGGVVVLVLGAGGVWALRARRSQEFLLLRPLSWAAPSRVALRGAWIRRRGRTGGNVIKRVPMSIGAVLPYPPCAAGMTRGRRARLATLPAEGADAAMLYGALGLAISAARHGHPFEPPDGPPQETEMLLSSSLLLAPDEDVLRSSELVAGGARGLDAQIVITRYRLYASRSVALDGWCEHVVWDIPLETFVQLGLRDLKYQEQMQAGCLLLGIPRLIASLAHRTARRGWRGVCLIVLDPDQIAERPTAATATGSPDVLRSYWSRFGIRMAFPASPLPLLLPCDAERADELVRQVNGQLDALRRGA